MDNETATELFFDQGYYYPAVPNYYGYYCTGFESPVEWNDHHKFFSSDGSDLHYSGFQTENTPYVYYYTPNYEYAQPPYNPYNPYVSGAILGVDSPFVGTQQYYSNPNQYPISSSAFVPVNVQPGSEFFPNTSLDPILLHAGVPSSVMPDIIPKHTRTAASAVVVGPTKKSASGNARKDSALAASHQLHAANLSKGSKVDSALAASHQPVLLGTTSRTASYPIPSQVTQNRSVSSSTQVANHFSQGNLSSVRDHQIKIPVPANDGFVDVASNGWGWMEADKFRPRLQYGMTNGNASLGMLSGQNRSPRTNRSKGQWASSISSKSYIPRPGANNVQENSIIYADQFNKDDFSVNYPNAKFFVIKSYSEDDVHKSIKYNVWSSTPSGNRKLAAAYEDAHQISAGNPKDCPIFLFFSVNASGQFCGVAEMVGPVDFHKDMDFWQQDKWTGSFPVKWHIVKDVPNASFRHIILENNENKPVTNSRDTQEVPYVQGITMLNMFKYNPLKTSLLDVFVYYEERQKIMQEEKSRFLGGTYDGSFFTPSFIPSNKPNGIVEPLLTTEEKPVEYNGMGKTNDTVDHPQKTEEKHVKDTGDDLVISEADGDDLESERKGMKLKYAEDVVTKIGSLSIESKDDHTNRDALEDVIVGTIPVKANGFEGKSP